MLPPFGKMKLGTVTHQQWPNPEVSPCPHTLLKVQQSHDKNQQHTKVFGLCLNLNWLISSRNRIKRGGAKPFYDSYIYSCYFIFFFLFVIYILNIIFYLQLFFTTVTLQHWVRALQTVSILITPLSVANSNPDYSNCKNTEALSYFSPLIQDRNHFISNQISLLALNPHVSGITMQTGSS